LIDFIAYVVAGMVWFTVLRRSAGSRVIDGIKADLDLSITPVSE
jgi:hypothetical protein